MKSLTILLLLVLILSCGVLNTPPNPPSSPNPPDGAEDVPIEVILTWSASDPDGDLLKFDLYFGKDEDPPLIVRDLDVKSYDPGPLEYSTTYYWKVVVKDEKGGKNESPVWKFTTIAKPENIVFQDDFESYEVGSTPEPVWNYWSRGNASARIVEKDGSKVLKVSDQDSEGSVEIRKDFEPIDEGYVMFKFEVEDPSCTVKARAGYGGPEVGIEPFEDGLYLSTPSIRLKKIQTGRWYTVRIEFDLAHSDNYEVYVDGEYVGVD